MSELDPLVDHPEELKRMEELKGSIAVSIRTSTKVVLGYAWPGVPAKFVIKEDDAGQLITLMFEYSDVSVYNVSLIVNGRERLLVQTSPGHPIDLRSVSIDLMKDDLVEIYCEAS